MKKSNFALDKQSMITPDMVEQAKGSTDSAVNPAELAARKGQLGLILESANAGFKQDIAAATIVARLAHELHELRAAVEPFIWTKLIPLAQEHPVREYLQQDPFTQWSFDKPRGYSGDATLLDIYYRHESAQSIVDAATPLGREIYEYTSHADSSVAGRERCQILTQFVDDTARETPGAEVLSIACGHLREAEKSNALAEGSLKRWVALDQDPESVTTVRDCNDNEIVQPTEGSVRGLLRRSYDLGAFDLVYASGLYDYLPRAVGVRLLQRCLELVKPGGKMLFANFSDEITTDGYMETFMDWPLILRSGDDMMDIAVRAIDRNQADLNVFYGSNRNIVYATITKKS